MTDIEESKFRSRYSEIIKGRSRAFIDKKQVFIKHPSIIDQGETDFNFLIYYDRAIQNGILTEEQKTLSLKNSCLWTDQDEKKWRDTQFFVKSLKENLPKMPLTDDRKSAVKELDNNEKLFKELDNKRESFIGFTAEKYTNKKITELQIFSSFYKDTKCEIPLYSEEEFDEIEEEDLLNLIECFNNATRDYNNGIVKNVALSSFVQGFIGLVGENSFDFLGKGIANFTIYQTHLLIYAKFFKNILSDSKNPPPSDFLDKPDDLIEWYNMSRSAAKTVENHKSSDSIMVIGSSEDAAQVAKASGGDSISLCEAAKQNGGKLNRNELFKMLG